MRGLAKLFLKFGAEGAIVWGAGGGGEEATDRVKLACEGCRGYPKVADVRWKKAMQYKTSKLLLIYII